ncbi:MAG: ABC transporter substrate-binding protein [Desulfobacteraceae bacterium]|nr:ABC transporter substrate-binding protein [Desulfobacteraceae bacterium]
MKRTIRWMGAFAVFCWVSLFLLPAAMAVNAKYDFDHFPDMSDYDPNNIVKPEGDTIKIAIIAAFSGPAAAVGQSYLLPVGWVAHDINKRGGIMVDGKKKKIEIIIADNQNKPDVTLKVTERMILQEKVDILWGTSGSHLQKVINQLADKHKKISVNAISLSDELMDKDNFTKYAFMTCFSTEQIGRAFAYFYGQIRKKETKFYILNQDYLFGHSLAEGFKVGLKEYFPTAQIVGEDYHKLFLTDFAPYLTKIKTSGAEVIFTGDWIPDAANLLKQSRQMGVMLPFANIFLSDPTTLTEVGIEGTTGLMAISQSGTGNPVFKNEGIIKYFKVWDNLWKNKWAKPYNSLSYKYPMGALGTYMTSVYWLASVLERAGSTDPEKVIKVWEGDSYQTLGGKVMTMRACDHKMVTDLHIYEFVPPAQQKQCFNIEPYYWFEKCAGAGPVYEIPSDKAIPKADPELCKKN